MPINRKESCLIVWLEKEWQCYPVESICFMWTLDNLLWLLTLAGQQKQRLFKKYVTSKNTFFECPPPMSHVVIFFSNSQTHSCTNSLLHVVLIFLAVILSEPHEIQRIWNWIEEKMGTENSWLSWYNFLGCTHFPLWHFCHFFMNSPLRSYPEWCLFWMVSYWSQVLLSPWNEARAKN